MSTRPRVDYESNATGLDRNETGALFGDCQDWFGGGARGRCWPTACGSRRLGADIDAFGLARGHRPLTVSRKGGMIITIPSGASTPPGSSIRPSAHRSKDKGPIFPGTGGRTTMRYDRARVSLGAHRPHSDRVGHQLDAGRCVDDDRGHTSPATSASASVSAALTPGSTVSHA